MRQVDQDTYAFPIDEVGKGYVVGDVISDNKATMVAPGDWRKYSFRIEMVTDDEYIGSLHLLEKGESPS